MRLRACGLAFSILVGATNAFGQDYEIVRRFILQAGNPRDRLLAASDGNLYGTALDEGEFAQGAIFRFVPDGAGGFTYELLYSFHGMDGFQPRGLVEGNHGHFYGTTTRGGAYGWGTAFVFDLSGTLVQLHDFTGGSDGRYPHDLIRASDGQFYGTTFQGGASDRGTVYRLSPAGGLTTLHEFAPGEGATPSTRLLQASDGNLYGVTGSGGATDSGTAFRVDSAGNLTTIHDFDSADGQNPRELIQAPDGSFYGSSCGGGAGAGTVFRMDSSGAVSTLHSFNFFTDGGCPYTGLTAGADGNFYGTTYDGGPGLGGFGPAGGIYHLAPDLSFHTDAFFSSQTLQDPRAPVAALIQASDGAFYGLTSAGGSGQQVNSFGFGGTFFRFVPSAGTTILHDFGFLTGVRNPAGELVEAADGNLYGTAGGGLRCCDFGPGTIYRLRASPLIVHEFLFDEGEGPNDLLAASDGNLYGVAANNGPAGHGTVYRVDLSGNLTVLHGFPGGTDGGDPEAGVTEAPDGFFYGTTRGDIGSVYRVDGSGNFNQLHLFTGPDGLRPQGRPVLATNGFFYGTAGEAGANGLGTVFKIDAQGTFSKIHDFAGGADGGAPKSDPIEAADGNLYGTTYGGGPEGLGTVYRIDASDTVTVIHSFTSSECANPFGRLLQAPDGFLYGACTSGPGSGTGTVFRMDTSGVLATIHTFQAEEASMPKSGLLASTDGMLYGTAAYGGTTDTGLVYRIDLAGAPPSVVGVVPTSGRSAGATVVTVTGDHARPGAGLSFAATPAHALMVFDAFTIFAVTPPLLPGTLNDVTVLNSDSQSAVLAGAFFADFLDAPGDNQFHAEVEAIFRAGITVGCGGGNYCTDAPASRAQMAVLLLKVEHGPTYVPPACTGAFPDVVCPSLFADWIEQFAAEEITAGCGGGNYCPADPVTRDQLAVLILKYEHGPAYVPPACTGIFADVPCPSQFADWIEQFAAEKVTVGCGNGNYCPDDPTTRGQMAVFLTKALGLP